MLTIGAEQELDSGELLAILIDFAGQSELQKCRCGLPGLKVTRRSCCFVTATP